VKILFLCHRLPYPPNRGARIRPFNVIHHLSRTHEVTVACLIRSASEAAAARDLKAHCAKLLTARVGALSSTARMLARLPTRSPLSFGYFYSPRLARMISEEVRRTQYDLAFVHCSSVAPYVSGLSLPKILDFGDMDSEKWMIFAARKRLPASLVYRLEGRRLQRHEAALAACFDACTCTTPAEVDTLRSLGFTGLSEHLHNGVDSAYFEPSAEPYRTQRACFLGQMDYYPNEECVVHFCQDILPRIRARRADAELIIIGAQPSRRVRALARMPGVTVTGAVADVRPYARTSALSIAPMSIARGTQNKILESLAMGVPVVCSSLAARGVDVVPGEHLLTADDPSDFADAVLRLMNDPAERRRFAAAGRARVVSHHSWADSMTQLDRLICRLTRRTSLKPCGPAASG
jgi:sugar transferase (PEP-CTERM/EpsH1 system associated)